MTALYTLQPGTIEPTMEFEWPHGDEDLTTGHRGFASCFGRDCAAVGLPVLHPERFPGQVG